MRNDFKHIKDMLALSHRWGSPSLLQLTGFLKGWMWELKNAGNSFLVTLMDPGSAFKTLARLSHLVSLSSPWQMNIAVHSSDPPLWPHSCSVFAKMTPFPTDPPCSLCLRFLMTRGFCSPLSLLILNNDWMNLQLLTRFKYLHLAEVFVRSPVWLTISLDGWGR